MENRDVVLVVIDSLRYKDLALEDNLAPFLQSRRDSGIWLENYYSTSPWTVPAHASILTGQLPSEHGTTTENTYFNAENSLISRLPDYYYSVGLSENGLFSDELGFADGFDEFRIFKTENRGGEAWRKIWQRDDESSSRLDKYLNFSKSLIASRDLQSVSSLVSHLKQKFSDRTNPGFVDQIISSILSELNRDRSSFVFANLMPTHYPYTFSSAEREYIGKVSKEDLDKAIASYNHEDYLLNPDIRWDEESLELRKKGYHASISYVDKKLKSLYQEAPEDAIFVVLGDHGELFGEQEVEEEPIIGHHFGTFEELIHVPLVIFSKKGVNLDLVEDEVTSHICLPELIQGLISSEDFVSKDTARSEYFGLEGYYDQFDRSYPEKLKSAYSRKSFSLIDNKSKIDLTSDGLYSWDVSSLSEKIVTKTDSEASSKLRILYSHYLN